MSGDYTVAEIRAWIVENGWDDRIQRFVDTAPPLPDSVLDILRHAGRELRAQRQHDQRSDGHARRAGG